MKKSQRKFIWIISIAFLLLAADACNPVTIRSDHSVPELKYTVTMDDPASHLFHIELSCSGWVDDTIVFLMPEWMPGYYQIMNYAGDVSNFSAVDDDGSRITVSKPGRSNWQLAVQKGKTFRIEYDVFANKRFVANSYLDTTHAYIIPEAAFLYIKNHLDIPVQVRIITPAKWDNIATGLESVPGDGTEFFAPDFGVLYDSPFLIGKLEELNPFEINGIVHRFIGYKIGNFDTDEFMKNLYKVVKTGTDIIGEIPYKNYTFIAIGPGRGGIEHSNSATVSFNGNGLESQRNMNGVMSFLAHEFFHLYNVKRIRPFELGPFDYGKENKTNLLWVSEGLTVYYEYLIIERAGLSDSDGLLSDFGNSINAIENNPGRFYQSLVQSSFNTWNEGPFGNQGADPGKSISYYDKGPCVGLILDFAIRHATDNQKSLDDVMRLLYNKYYLELNRGFTDAEFQEACETCAGISLDDEFEYVYTTKEIDYNKYLAYAGLKLTEKTDRKSGKKKFNLTKLDTINNEQQTIFASWTGE